MKKISKTRRELISLFRGNDKQLTGLLGFNQATNQYEILTDRTLKNGYTVKKGLLDDSTLATIWGYISEKWKQDFSDKEIANVCTLIARQNSFNPIKDFLNEAQINAHTVDPFEIIVKYINIEDTDYNRTVLDLFFRGAIARILTPGIKFDYCLDLVGKQGTGKTTFLEEIFMGYSVVINNYLDKDELLKMLTAWVVMDDELVASSRLAFSTLKRTITDTTVNLRKPYGRITDKIPVNFVHARTTNDFEHLIDATGDRRFLPVGTLPRKVGQPIKITKEDIVNIWGNYYRSYLNNSKLFYDNDSFEGKLIEKVRRRFKPHDEINEKVAWYLECEIPNNFYSCKISDKERRHFYKDIEQKGKYSKNQKWEVLVPRTKVSMNHLVNELFDEGLDSGTKQQIRTYLNHLENWEKRDSIAFSKSCNTSGWTNIKK